MFHMALLCNYVHLNNIDIMVQFNLHDAYSFVLIIVQLFIIPHYYTQTEHRVLALLFQ